MSTLLKVLRNQPTSPISPVTHLVTFASLLTPLSNLSYPPLSSLPPCRLVMFLLSAPTCGFWVWGKAEVAFEDGDSQVCLGPKPWMQPFVRVPRKSLYAAPQLHSSLTLFHPNKLTWTRSCPRRGPHRTNDPANYVFKVFGSCENSFELVVVGGRGCRGEEGV